MNRAPSLCTATCLQFTPCGGHGGGVRCAACTCQRAASAAASATAAACNEAQLTVPSCLPGLWDVLSSQRAVDFARARLRAHNDAAACSRDLVCAGALVHHSKRCSIADSRTHSIRVEMCVELLAYDSPLTGLGIHVQVEHALQLHTTDNVSVITVCFRDAPPPPRRGNREASRQLPFLAFSDICRTLWMP